MTSLPFNGSHALSDALSDVARRVQQVTVEVKVPRAGGGSGVVWPLPGRADSDLIVTNAHVAQTGTVTVVRGDGDVRSATRVAVDPSRDLAVLRTTQPFDRVATVGSAGALTAGDLVLAVGAPLGVPQALALGVVHGVLRDDHDVRAVRSDVKLMPGNSGGPLTDARGHVVGINTLVMQGLGVAVSSETVQRFLREQDRPRLGVSVRPVTVRRSTPRRSEAPALLVLDVERASLAERAGLQLGDVVLSAGGRRLDRSESL
nr:trypsin-like peptidase domain-containing protein [Gemmatimonadaceae bacterium]